jgi:hypothetical protein
MHKLALLIYKNKIFYAESQPFLKREQEEETGNRKANF